jgi:hypothetical protein
MMQNSGEENLSPRTRTPTADPQRRSTPFQAQSCVAHANHDSHRREIHVNTDE